ncbi:MmgE/PrpD family protein [compost metagenome]
MVYHIWGEQLSSQLNEALFTQNLWEPPLIENNYFKLIPSCRFAHAPIEALQHLIAKHAFSSNQVSSIQVDIHRLGANMSVAAPPNMLAAMFSIPFLLSLVLHKKSLYLKENDSLLQDRQLQISASLVQVIEDPTLTALLPNIRAAKVTVKLHGGEILSETVQSPRGSYEQHLELDQQFAKFYPYLDEDSHESFKHMLDTTMKLETMHTDEWIATLQHK